MAKAITRTVQRTIVIFGMYDKATNAVQKLKKTFVGKVTEAQIKKSFKDGEFFIEKKIENVNLSMPLDDFVKYATECKNETGGK